MIHLDKFMLKLQVTIAELETSREALLLNARLENSRVHFRAVKDSFDRNKVRIVL